MNAEESAPTPRKAISAAAIILALAGIKFLITVATSGRYGYHRDELYYIACGRHLALGYVDFPPVTPLLARLAEILFGTSLTGLRLFPAIAGTVILLLTAWMARELGGGRFAQVLAALAILLSPMYLGGNLLFQTVTFDQLAWVIVLCLVIRLVKNDDQQLWLAIGAAFGFGLLTKYTIIALGIGLVGGLLLTPARRQLLTPWPWLGALIALLMVAPNLVWQIQHNWPTLDYLRQHQSESGSRLDFIVQQILLIGPPSLPLALLGFVQLFRQHRYRLLGWTCVLVQLILLLSSGKPYYAGPLYPILFAAGAVGVADFAVRRRADWLRPAAAGLVLLGILAVPISIPLLPAQTMADTDLWKVRKDYADMVGWPEMAASVAHVYDGLPEAERRSTVILGWSYGLTAPIDFYGPRYGLPTPISPHLTYYYWKPAHVDATTVIALGVPHQELTTLFRDVTQVGTVGNDLGIPNEEFGSPIYLCRGPKVSLDDVWPKLQRFN